MRAPSHPTDGAAPAPEWSASLEDEQWGWAEAFLLLQFLWGVALFVPGMQAYRAYVRALPYVTSLGALVYYYRRPTGEGVHASAKWLMASLGILVLNLLHSTSHSAAGVAQVVFQLSILAPVLWMTRAVRSEAKLDAAVVDRLRVERAQLDRGRVAGLLPRSVPAARVQRARPGDESGAGQLAHLSWRRRAGDRPAARLERSPRRRGGGGDADDGARRGAGLPSAHDGRGARGLPGAGGRRHDGVAADAGAIADAGRGGQRRRVRVAAAAPGAGDGRGRQPGLRRGAGGGRLRLGRRRRRRLAGRAIHGPPGRRRRQHVQGGARRVPDLHAVGVAVRVSLRCRASAAGA